MPTGKWVPGDFRRFVATNTTSTRVAQVETDTGSAFVKALGNPEGPHALVSEWVGTSLADWLGLPTLDYAIMELQPQDEIELEPGLFANRGPAFVTRFEENLQSWNGLESQLDRIENADDITRLVVLDTWVLNRDRHAPKTAQRRPNPDNVALKGIKGASERYKLMAIDHTHCFTRSSSEITKAVGDIDHVKCEEIYGLFPAFQKRLSMQGLRDALDRMSNISEGIDRIIDAVPDEWLLEPGARGALRKLVVGRSGFLASWLPHALSKDYPQLNLGLV